MLIVNIQNTCSHVNWLPSFNNELGKLQTQYISKFEIVTCYYSCLKELSNNFHKEKNKLAKEKREMKNKKYPLNNYIC